MAYTSGLLKHRVTILNRMRKSTPNAGVLFSYLIAEEVMLRWLSFTMIPGSYRSMSHSG